MFDILLTVIAAALVAVTILARLPLFEWWARACDFPRVQFAVAAALVLGLSAFTSQPWQVSIQIMGLAVLLWQGWRILPYTPVWPRQVQTAQTGNEDYCFTVLVANVLTSNRNASGLLEQIERWQPDLVLTLESDQWWQDQLDPALAAEWPHAVRIPQDNLYGMHLYSRLPLVDTEVKWLVQDDIPSIHTWLRLRSGDTVRLYALHPRPPAPGESEESLWRDAELLLVGKRITKRQDPCIVMGDLNDVAWSRTTRLFCRVSGMLDPRRGRGMFSSFHADYWFLRWPLDHLFSSEHFTLKHMYRLKPFGSDHFPILVKFCYRPSRSGEHENPEADAEDQEQARETIGEGRARKQKEDR
ncbi:endonuclease/exonuclease/phosphatase family protein [Marinobacter daqiaonensis]|uniref:endonuclease/exonuclease/phosphatase family protein n=1 Tax=Marinobacter daqiaonensis TaxID=650891 RepID=UPI000B830665|nr:endonuclease/exonuclease/phosphatase family protein [Marinobacter daqiaonensis]